MATWSHLASYLKGHYPSLVVGIGPCSSLLAIARCDEWEGVVGVEPRWPRLPGIELLFIVVRQQRLTGRTSHCCGGKKERWISVLGIQPDHMASEFQRTSGTNCSGTCHSSVLVLSHTSLHIVHHPRPRWSPEHDHDRRRGGGGKEVADELWCHCKLVGKQ